MEIAEAFERIRNFIGEFGLKIEKYIDSEDEDADDYDDHENEEEDEDS